MNGEFIEDQRFIEVFPQLGGFDLAPTAIDEAHKRATLRQLAERRVVELTLLRQIASKAGFTVTLEEVSARRTQQWGTSSASVCGMSIQQQLANDLLVEKYCDWLCRYEPRPSRAEVEQYYLRRRAEFWLPERLRAAHIVCNIELPAHEESARMRIEQAEQELMRGLPFAKVADRYSYCGGKTILGWIERGAMVPEFEQAVYGLPQGGRSSIFRTVFGLHIATVLRKKPAGFEPFIELRPVLARRMLAERRRRVVETATEQAFRTASIELVPEAGAIT